MKEEIKEYIELEKRQREIRKDLSLEDVMNLFDALEKEGLGP